MHSVGQGSVQRGAEQALAVIDGKPQKLPVFGIAHVDGAGLLVDFASRALVDIDTVDRAGLGALVACDAPVGLEFVNPAIARREAQVLLGVLDRDSLLKAILDRDPQSDRNRLEVVVNVLEIIALAHSGKRHLTCPAASVHASCSPTRRVPASPTPEAGTRNTVETERPPDPCRVKPRRTSNIKASQITLKP